MVRRYHDLVVTAFIHVTEDKEKVMTAMENLIGSPVVDEVKFSEAEGHFHNPIIYLTLNIRRERRIKDIIDRWEEMEFWKQAKEDLEERLDDGLAYHVRVDKSKAYMGEIVLWAGGEAINIRLKPATYPASRDGALSIIIQGPGSA